MAVKGTDEWEVVKGKVGEKEEEKVISIAGTGSLEKFKFELVRLKEKETKHEKLLIHANYESEDYGTLVTNIGKIHSDILKLSENGIHMKRKHFNELAKKIDDSFYDVMIQEKESVGNNVEERTVEEIVKYFKEYIKDNNIEKDTNGCHNIPVEEFSREYKGTTFKADEKDVREALRIYGYTKCNANRNDLTVKMGKENEKKAVKCISFYADRADKEG